MVAAYPFREGRFRHVATSLFTLGGSRLEFVCDCAGIHRCFPVRINNVRIADRLRRQSRGFRTKTMILLTATLTFNIQGGEIDQIARYRGYGGKWSILPR